jgi:hypothetical protein
MFMLRLAPDIVKQNNGAAVVAVSEFNAKMHSCSYKPKLALSTKCGTIMTESLGGLRANMK